MSGSWEALVPAARTKSGHLHRAPVQISIPAVGTRITRGVTITVFAAQLDGITWLVPDAPVTVSIGTGAFLGHVRLTPGGLMRMRGAPHRSATASVSVRLTELAARLDLPSSAMKSFCEVDWAPDWLEFKLPDWARVKTPAVLTASTLAASLEARPPVATPQKGKPFLGVAQRTGVAGVPAAPLPVGRGV